MNLPNPDAMDWNDYMREALMAQFMLIQKPMRTDDELIPGRDDLEGESE